MYIYGLCDPSTKELRYIGLTKNSLAFRLKCHIKDSRSKKRHVQCWIRSLEKEPIIIELDKCESYEELKKLEAEYIAYYKFIGANLCNHTVGGEGTKGFRPSEETKKKLAELNTGKKWTKEAIEKFKKTRIGMKYSEGSGKRSWEARRQMAEFRKNNPEAPRPKKRTPEELERVRLRVKELKRERI